MPSISKTYLDLNEAFIPHPITGDLTRVYDETAIKQALKSIVLTNHFDIPFSPWKGANLIALLFEPATPLTTFFIESNIRDAIAQEEPRVVLDNLVVTFIDSTNEYNVRIVFHVIGSNTPHTIETIIQRVR